LQNIHLNPTDPSIQKIIVLSFNRAFYCIHTNDAEVSCNGLLFFGSNYTPVISLDENEKARLHTLIDVLNEEFIIRDQNQDEMLRILLKRFIIRCTRLARIQMSKSDIHEGQIDIIREFNILVEEHFKRLKKVSDYADLMHRSPKTLTNVFRLQSETSPLQIIHDRIALEARRLLLFTDKPVKEIAIDLGFEDPALFSRFFKNQTGLSTQEFKEQNKKNRF
jgi:AraC-like DNA-binding protein